MEKKEDTKPQSQPSIRQISQPRFRVTKKDSDVTLTSQPISLQPISEAPTQQIPNNNNNNNSNVQNIVNNNNNNNNSQPALVKQKKRRRRTSLIILQESEDNERELRERSGRKFVPNKIFKTEELIEDTIPIDDFHLVDDAPEDNNTKLYSGLTTTPSDLALLQAASFVDDANTGRYEMHKIDSFSLNLYYLYHKVLFRYTILFCVVVQTFLLPLIEPPQTITIIPETWAVVIELLIILYFLFVIAFKYSFLVTFNSDYSRFTNENRKSQVKDQKLSFFDFYVDSQQTNKMLTIIYLLILGIFFIDIIIWSVSYSYYGQTFHYSRILRPFFIIYFIKPIQMSIYTIIKMLPTLLEITFVILFFIAAWSVMCYLLFFGTEESAIYLDSIGNSFVSFYTLMTTANYPDVMMPSYSANPWTCLFFIIFLLITTYLLKNLVLAYVFKTYSDLMRAQYKRIALFEHQRLYFAFTLLDPADTGGISYNTFEKFMNFLRPSFSKGKNAFIFRIMNVSNSGMISIEEFLKLLKILEMKIYQKKKITNEWELKFPHLYEILYGPYWRDVLRSKGYEYFMLMMVILNVARIMVLFLNGRECVLLSSYLEIGFYFLFVSEIFLKIFALGLHKTFSTLWNVLDLLIVLSTLLLNVILLFNLGLGEQGCSGEFTKILYFAPALRLLRVLALSDFFHEILRTISLITPALFTYISLQLIMFYFWVILGMEVWGGEIYRGNPKLIGTPFDALDYYQNSFNNFIYAYITCFELLVVNNWQFIASGYVALSGGIAWVFFISFNVWTVLIIMNWVIASIIESYGVFSEVEVYDETSFKVIIRRLNRRWSQNYNSYWHAKEKRKFKISLSMIYGGEETIEYVRERLGEHDEAIQRSRDILYEMKAYFMNDTRIKVSKMPGEQQPLLLK